jgi:hypothetical protein
LFRYSIHFYLLELNLLLIANVLLSSLMSLYFTLSDLIQHLTLLKSITSADCILLSSRFHNIWIFILEKLSKYCHWFVKFNLYLFFPNRFNSSTY